MSEQRFRLARNTSASIAVSLIFGGFERHFCEGCVRSISAGAKRRAVAETTTTWGGRVEDGEMMVEEEKRIVDWLTCHL